MQLGRYQLIREIGCGGMSTVYEAEDTRIGRQVAVKVIASPVHHSEAQREGAITRLKREARAIARLSHPNVVTIYDIGEQDGQHYLVTEYLRGQTLRARLDEGPLPAQEASRILDQVADALDAVHAEDVVHRDIKPANVMLLPDGRVKLMDFGVARTTDDTMVTQANMIVGSPAYMAPEQINTGAFTPATDLWSLGALLYEMLAGRPPFAADTIPAVLYQVTHERPAPLPGASAAIQRVLRRALERDPARRYPSARALASDFRDALAVAPVRISPAATRPLPSIRRPAIAVALLVLLALGTNAALITRSVLHSKHAPHSPTALSAGTPPQVWVASARQERILPPDAVPTITPTPHPPAPRLIPHPRRLRHLYNPWTAPVKVVSAKHWAKPHRQPRIARANSAPRPRARRAAPIRMAMVPYPRYTLAPAARRASSTPAFAVGTTLHGTHTRNPAMLTITRSQGDTFQGVMTVRTHEATVRVAVAGRASPRTGQFAMRETRVLSSTHPRAWDLGRESGHVTANGRAAGTGTDVRGRSGTWSFSR